MGFAARCDVRGRDGVKAGAGDAGRPQPGSYGDAASTVSLRPRDTTSLSMWTLQALVRQPRSEAPAWREILSAVFLGVDWAVRLSPTARDIIRATTREVFGEQAQVRLFGSRTDDAQRGGDIDLLVELPSPQPDARRKSLARLASSRKRAVQRLRSGSAPVRLRGTRCLHGIPMHR
jgi:predicted nucleotidyltransferase